MSFDNSEARIPTLPEVLAEHRTNEAFWDEKIREWEATRPTNRWLRIAQNLLSVVIPERVGPPVVATQEWEKAKHEAEYVQDLMLALNGKPIKHKWLGPKRPFLNLTK